MEIVPVLVTVLRIISRLETAERPEIEAETPESISEFGETHESKVAIEAHLFSGCDVVEL